MPSSSHTAGAARIGRVARDLFGRQPKWVKIHLYGSFAETYRGHGTDVAIVGGLLNYDTDDERIKTAFDEFNWCSGASSFRSRSTILLERLAKSTFKQLIILLIAYKKLIKKEKNAWVFKYLTRYLVRRNRSCH